MSVIKILDCTLRDGGHVNEAKFRKENIYRITHGLTEAKIDYVELGFLRDGDFSEDQSNYNDVTEIYDSLPEHSEGTIYTVMVRPDWYDICQLSPCNGKISTIRFAFYYKDFELLQQYVKKARDLGYRVICNPVNINGYTDTELLELVERINEIMPDQLTMVDTYGAFTYSKMRRRYYMIEENLAEGIRVGLHLHENMGLTFALAQDFLNILDSKRDVVIDGSLMGMGRTPGNLPIEILSDYMNDVFGRSYNLDILYKLIGDIINPIKDKIPWGYSPAYFTTGKLEMHRSYAEYLLRKNNLKIGDIRNILVRITDKYDRNFFNAKLVEKLYREYIGDIDG